jgi:hypothetical protein
MPETGRNGNPQVAELSEIPQKTITVSIKTAGCVRQAKKTQQLRPFDLHEFGADLLRLVRRRR